MFRKRNTFHVVIAMRDPESFVIEGPTSNSDNVFFLLPNSDGFFVCFLCFYLMRRERFQIPLKADHYQPASEHATSMVFRLQGDDCPTLKAELLSLQFFRVSRPVLLRNPIAL